MYSEEEIAKLCAERGCSEDADPKAYLGLGMIAPQTFTLMERDPTKEDIADIDGKRFECAHLWINKKASTIWVLDHIKNKEACWLCFPQKDKEDG